MKTPERTEKRPRGRPRSFDRDKVLDAAVLVFWEKGYDGASIESLTGAMGINRPSLYATFGSKRELFIQAIDRYAATRGNQAFSAFRLEPENRKAVERFFEASIECATEEGKPRGCLINTVATDAAENDAELRDKLSKMFSRTDTAIAKRLRANQDGEPSGIHDPEGMARMAHSVTHSIMTRARAGASRKELAEIAATFMAVLFPSPNQQPAATIPARNARIE
ncbi:MAG: TetR/AcrR family transcriptional regulator [Acidimicrobiia bacterium]|nr:TetR/AcrR family transcriptional regulator [Acidimicrobiia bacterium]MDX2467123.1 TetR/AcrR family transcriptional regulator [Acidimicrobiia bacterium]